jgi:hypothetical protein
MNAATIVMLISVVASLALAARAMRSHGMGMRDKVLMALAWVVIIAAVALVFARIGG